MFNKSKTKLLIDSPHSLFFPTALLSLFRIPLSPLKHPAREREQKHLMYRLVQGWICLSMAEYHNATEV